ncbi:MAG: restriction endonuclease subunit S [Phaeodactylibacter xiamenensis]|uniref:restriction endonuclease subunit S n=1 Tax=Phaeodactylibacter xiamenensis TaxID=1524460 RepID=UPI00069829BA|nr:restriction endonuclease subunit S [Phaeodactylibacter xiamenensis]MCR9050696.1 restriction endonuclease subunit S [bacterium]
MKWELLDSLAEKINYGHTASSGTSGYKFLRITDIQDGDVDWEKVPFAECDQVEKYALNSGDLLFARTGATTGKSYLIKECPDRSIFASYLIRVRPNLEKVNPNFLAYFFQSQIYWNQILTSSNGATLPGVNATKLKSLQIPLPPLSEQRRLSARLDKADAVRQKSRALLEEYAELGRSVFLEVFGDPVRNERGWEVVELVDHVKILGGGTPSKKNKSFYTGEIPWVSPKDMKSLFIDSSIDKITNEAIKNSSTKLIPKDSVLMVVRSGILKKQLPVGINICPVTLNQDMKAFVCKEKLNPYYLLYLFLVLAPNILKSVRGTTADNISSDVLKKLQIPLPPLPLQTRFAAMVANIEAQRRLAERQLEAAEAVFGGVLQGTFER